MKVGVLRWILAIGCVGGCIHQTTLVLRMEGSLAAAGPLILAFAALIAALLLVSPEVIVPVAAFLGDRLTDVVFPGARAERPPLSYLLSDRYRDHLRFDEAMAEYEKILRHYPEELRAYEELLALAARTGDDRRFTRYQRRFGRRFRAAQRTLEANRS